MTTVRGSNGNYATWQIEWDHELLERFGERLSDETLQSKTGRVVVTTYERGWTLLGESKVHNPAFPSFGKYTAEIAECTSAKPRCLKKHAAFSDVPDSHMDGYCHDLGHEDAIKKLAEQTLKTY